MGKDQSAPSERMYEVARAGVGGFSPLLLGLCRVGAASALEPG